MFVRLASSALVRNHRRSLLAVAVASLAGCATTPSGPSPLWLGQVSQGATTQDVAPKSWKELKFTNLVRQQTDFSCGAAAMATIFKYAYGKRTTEQQVLVNMLKVADPDLVKEKGFSLLDMKNYAKAVGMAAEGYQVEYDALKELKVPAIALLNLNGYKHFVIIRKADDHYVHVGDPALANRVMSRANFQKSWNQVLFVMTGKGFDPGTVLLDPPPPLSARRLFGERSPVFNADAAEFGFGPAFNFRL